MTRDPRTQLATPKDLTKPSKLGDLAFVDYADLLASLTKDLTLPAIDVSSIGGLSGAAGYLFKPAKAYWAASGANVFSTGAYLPLDTLAFDETGGAMVLGTTTGGFVAPVAGYYFAAAQVSVLASAANQYVQATISVAGAQALAGAVWIGTTAASGSIQSSVSGIVKCKAGDKIQAQYEGVAGLRGYQVGQATNYLIAMQVA